MISTIVISYYLLNYLLKNEKMNPFLYFSISIVLRFFAKDYLMYIIFEILLMIAIVDYKTMYIYDVTLIIYGILIILSSSIHLEMIYGILFIGMLMLLNVRKERIGQGDLYLLMISCLKINLISICWVILISCVLAMVLFVLKQRKKNEYIPFAPYLCFSLILVIAYNG